MELFFRRYGTKGNKPLIILHGLFGMSDNWDSFARRFADKGLDVVVPDQRNHGRSGHSPVHSYEALCDDLLELVDKLEFGSVSLLGHSMGGKAAMQFAIDHPEKVDRLIVADISPTASGHNPQHEGLIDTMLGMNLKEYANRTEVDEALKPLIANHRIRQFLTKNIYWKDKSSLGWRVNLEVVKENLEEIFRGVDSSRPFDKPVLFLKGEKSDYIREASIRRIKELFPRAQIETIRNGTHWLHADNPSDFSRAVVFFLI
ncbi:MAG: alpha/beta fold hydrolase [Bacteroidales bacterium]